MKTSVIVTTYNGDKFILKQLISIHKQTTKADEVLIFDDQSTDSTAQICQHFIEENNLSDSWKFTINSKNKGYLANFIDGFYTATGDIIFICDQDDIWCDNKIERLIEIYKSNNNIKLISSAYSLFNDENGIYDKHAMVPNSNPNELKNIAIKDFIRFNCYMGMTISFKKELLLDNYRELCQMITYDISIAFLAVLHNGLYFLDEVLVNRRNHYSTTFVVADKWCESEFGGNKQAYDSYRRMLNLKGMYEFTNKYNRVEFISQLENAYKYAELRHKYYKNKTFVNFIKLVISKLKNSLNN